MTEALPILREDQITIDVDAGIASAAFLFSDGFLLTARIGWDTLREWAISSQAFEIKAAILEHYATLALLVMRARAMGETTLAL
jgi:hypothetical protein